MLDLTALLPYNFGARMWGVCGERTGSSGAAAAYGSHVRKPGCQDRIDRRAGRSPAPRSLSGGHAGGSGAGRGLLTFFEYGLRSWHVYLRGAGWPPGISSPGYLPRLHADRVSCVPRGWPGQFGSAYCDASGAGVGHHRGIDAGAQVLNLSVGLLNSSSRDEATLMEALDYARNRSVVVVTAAGNQGGVGGSVLVRHPVTIPVAACNLAGRPTGFSNLGHSIGRRGVSAPGEGVTSLGTNGEQRGWDGTSVAAAFVSATAALLCSEFPQARPQQVQTAIAQSADGRRRTIVPPLLDAWAAYRLMAGTVDRGLSDGKTDTRRPTR
jgi:Subtilase family